MNVSSQNNNDRYVFNHPIDNHPIDENQFIQMDEHATSTDITCCQQKIDIIICLYFKYLFFFILCMTNVCNIILNYKILNK
jgi:hypothetical protein